MAANNLTVHNRPAHLTCTVVSHCRHTFFRRLSLSIGQPHLHSTRGMYECRLPAQKSICTRNDKKYARALHSQNETLAAQRWRKTRDHCAQPASCFSSKRILINIIGLLTWFLRHKTVERIAFTIIAKFKIKPV